MLPRLRLFFLILILLPACPAAARSLTGLAEWRYAEYAAEEKGGEDIDGSHFTQKYSLMYEKKGLLYGGRAGRYAVDLGAEWAGLDSEFNGQEFKEERAKILYRGDVLLAPGGLPFRLHLYSHDLNSSRYLKNGSDDRDEIFDPNIFTALQDGQRIQTGATLMFGIRNGSYLGSYRDLLSQFPRVLVDYQENYVRDLESDTPEHYRQRNLAFVSLNKKDNWFHYRVSEYKDYIDSTNDYQAKSYMLGTVDYTLRRQWINLTNWIKVSADGSYSTTEEFSLQGRPTERRYDLNLFSVARRQKWQLSNFNTFSRIVDEQTREKNLEVPFFATGEVSRETAVRFRFIGSRERDEFLVSGIQSDEDILFASTRVETFRQQRYIVAPQLDMEIKRGDRGKGEGVRAGFEIYSNRKYRPRYDLFGAYSALHLTGEDIDGDEVDYWEHQLLGRVETQLTPRVRTGLQEKLLLGSGDLDRSAGQFVAPEGDLGLTGSTQGLSERSGDMLRSISTWFVEHRSTRRLDNRFELTYDLLRTDDDTSDQFILTHSLNYNTHRLFARMRNLLVFGEEIADTGFASNEINAGPSGSIDTKFQHTSGFRYSPGRTWETTADFDYLWRDGDAGDSSQWLVRQKHQYNLYKVNGIVRKYAEFVEEAEYERFVSEISETYSTAMFGLAGFYFPTRVTTLGARIRYRTYSPSDVEAFTYSLLTALNFPKFTVSFDYSYGTRTAGVDTLARDEHRWEVVVRKVF